MNALEIAAAYYRNFETHGDFDDVPMAEDLVFQSPMMRLDAAAAFRQAVQGLAQRVAGLEIRHQHENDDRVVSVYDFDLGLPGGPVPMAEVLTIESGRLRSVELIFDPAPLRPPEA